MNTITIIGNLGGDPDFREGPREQPNRDRATLSVAVTRRWGTGDAAGEETTWFRVTAWGATARNCREFLEKGRQVGVRGRMRSYKNDGDPESYDRWELVADEVQFLGGKRKVAEDWGKRDGPNRGQPVPERGRRR